MSELLKYKPEEIDNMSGFELSKIAKNYTDELAVKLDESLKQIENALDYVTYSDRVKDPSVLKNFFTAGIAGSIAEDKRNALSREALKYTVNALVSTNELVQGAIMLTMLHGRLAEAMHKEISHTMEVGFVKVNNQTIQLSQKVKEKLKSIQISAQRTLDSREFKIEDHTYKMKVASKRSGWSMFISIVSLIVLVIMAMKYLGVIA